MSKVIDFITPSEFEAAQIMSGSKYGGNSNYGPSIHELANRLIQLAEKIKAERAVVSMTGGPQ